jgi:murein L,D-transpeptidase YcbB/YkuD
MKHSIFLCFFVIFLLSCEKKPSEKQTISKVIFSKSIYKTTIYEYTPSQRKQLISVLRNSYEDGLNPSNYQIETLGKFEKKSVSLTNNEWIEFDDLLTSNLEKYIQHLTNGQLNPRKLYRNWDLKENKIDRNQLLLNIQKSNSIETEIEKLKPQNYIYKRLKKALKIIDSYPNDDFKKIFIKTKIVSNDSNIAIIPIKKRLIYWKDMGAKDSLSPIYDQKTVEALKRFQKRHGLAADGVIGKGTIEALNFTKTQRRGQIIANLERWKWFPRNMGQEYCIINIPDYKLTLIKNKDTLRTHRVIVGRAKRKTPVLSSKLIKVIFNPTWTVPPTILREDMIPEISKNRGYLAKTNIKIYDAKGNRISASNWQLANAKKYRYVQSPGTFNSLGMVKLIFPNRFSVYLHDTNHRDFFDKSIRSLSSGCIRLDNPFELTEYVLNDPTNWSVEKIIETLKNGKTKEVPIKKEIAIHVLYWTAWSEGNQLIFRDDIYNLDAQLFTKLNN